MTRCQFDAVSPVKLAVKQLNANTPFSKGVIYSGASGLVLLQVRTVGELGQPRCATSDVQRQIT